MIKRYFYFILFISITLSSCTTQSELSEDLSFRMFNYPVLQGKSDNPVARIRIEVPKGASKSVEGLTFALKQGCEKEVKKASIYYTENDSNFHTNKLFGKAKVSGRLIRINGNQELPEGGHYFWCALELSKEANLESKIILDLKSVDISGENFHPHVSRGSESLRLGVALRQHWQDSIHTYRIPGLVTTNQGSLLAVYDARREGSRDLQGHMDIGVSRSIDGGYTWEDMRIALDMKSWGGLPEKYNGVSDANILVDSKSGYIFIAGLWMHGVINNDGKWVEGLSEESVQWNHQWRGKGSQPGLGVKQTSQFLLTKSTDDGKSWSEPVNLTAMCKKPSWWLWAPAPGHGITLSDGTLVIPTQGRNENGLPFSNITYSKDGGATWLTSAPAYTNTTESMAVELSDNSIMLNMRNNRNRKEKGERNGRAVATTKDMGKTWTEHPSSCGALVESVCMASLHRHNYTDESGEKKSVLLFSNPNSKFKRHKQTIKVSFDDGLTWPEDNWIELDEGRGNGYSCLTSIDENTIGIIYEGSQADLIFQRILLKELIQ